ncbi:MAG: hypothetical protein Ct9H300mP12_01570 [Acidimicrobiales bacterium]|nr:MAG: hypothetical protein Ct9H300mP12_01570 [Acidimicrobiales bacterium]
MAGTRTGRAALGALATGDPESVLAVIGTADAWTPPDHVDDLEAAGATVLRYEGADHGFCARCLASGPSGRRRGRRLAAGPRLAGRLTGSAGSRLGESGLSRTDGELFAIGNSVGAVDLFDPLQPDERGDGFVDTLS